jgi:antiphage defense system Thoeris ThsB-like protein
MLHKVFISFHHDNDQYYKDRLLELNNLHNIFIDGSVDTGDISRDLPDESIRQIIRDDRLRDTTVTVVLVGTETMRRKHVDWEIYSSMFDGTVNKKSGVLVVYLPTIVQQLVFVGHENEKTTVYPHIPSWDPIISRAELERKYPCMPARIADNLLSPGAKVSVTLWDFIANNPEKLRVLIDIAFDDRERCEYDLSRQMKRDNS